MDNSIISEIHTKAYKDGIKEGMEIARQMLCKSLEMEIDSFGRACAHVDKLMWEKKHYEKATFDE